MGGKTISEKLLIVDGHAVVHRAFHAVRQELMTSKGELTNAVFGFTSILLKALQTERPDYWAISFDLPTPTFRHLRYADYKATRPPMPEPLRQQFVRVKQLVRAFSIPIYELDGFEADDVLGTLSRQSSAAGLETVIVTGDLDALQLVTATVKVLTPKRAADDIVLYDEAAVIERYGIMPVQIPDYKGLVGDTSDNIPGVRGIGEKTATKLLQTYGTVEGIYAHLTELPDKQRVLFETGRDMAAESKILATIIVDAPVILDLGSCRIHEYDRHTVLELFSELEFRALIPRLPQPAGPTVDYRIPMKTPVTLTPMQGLFSDVDTEASTASDQLALTTETRGGHTMKGNSASELSDEPDIFLAPAAMATPTAAYVIDTVAALDELIKRIRQKGFVAIDTETDALDPMLANLVGISAATDQGIAYYIPVAHKSGVQLPWDLTRKKLGAVLRDPAIQKIAHNGKYDFVILKQHGIDLQGFTFDTMIAAYLLNPTARGIGLKDLAMTHFSIEMTEIIELIGKGKSEITMADVPIAQASAYAAADADMTLRLYSRMVDELVDKGLDQLFRDVEMPLVPVLAEMELDGVDLDADFLAEMSQRLQKDMVSLADSIFTSIGHPFNLQSPKQLAVVLFEELGLPAIKKTTTGYSTDAGVLEGLRGQHDAVDGILEYRQMAKLKGTYVDGLPLLISPIDHRVHTDFNQTVAATGRLSSSNPNLQNIPIRTPLGREIRRAFIAAQPDEMLLAADYSQIELRILAHLSHDPILLDSFTHDHDIHVRTAALIYDVPEERVTSDQRRLAKTANYAIIYGLSEFGLSRDTGIPRKEAGIFLAKYNETYGGLYAYMEQTRADVRARGYVSTLMGRRRYMPEVYASSHTVRDAAERAAINMPVQGSQADLIKIAMVRLARELTERRLRSRMILQVHDELVFRVPNEEIAMMATLVRSTMSNAMQLDVPIKVDVKVGKNWLDMSPVEMTA